MPQREAVRLGADRDRYAVGQPIQATVENGMPRAIETFDHQTSCSIVTVQRLRDGAWEPVGPCPLASPTQVVALAAGQRVVLQLPAPPFANAFEPGVYRIEFRFAELDDQGKNPGPPRILHSAQFTIAAGE
jgi:hypothetical protein